MEKKDLRIVFMGTPEFAVETLKALVENGYNVVAVVTQPDKPVGRHQNEVQPSREDEGSCLRGAVAQLQSQSSGSGGFPYAARGGMGYACLWNF